MSAKERDRLAVFAKVKHKQLTVVEAARELHISLRQARRVWARYRRDGDAGLVHRLRGRPSNNRTPEGVRDRIIKRYLQQYSDFGPTFACEKLAGDGLPVSPDTLTALLKDRHLWQPRRRRAKHRKRRPRRACFGSLVQLDGSHHDWFEGRSSPCVLMVMIDDATNRMLARFYPAETTEAALDLFGRWTRRYGLPRSVYPDRHSIYQDQNDHERLTQFARAMKELQVRLILARSPQAKGRVERRNALLQDRLVKELRLRKIRSMQQANAFLEHRYLAELNDRFSIPPQKAADLHRLPPADRPIEQILCIKEDRVVGNDWCVRWNNRWLQIAATHAPLHLPGRKVELRQTASGDLLLNFAGRPLQYQLLGQRPAAPKKLIVNNRAWRPGPKHPWARKRNLKKTG